MATIINHELTLKLKDQRLQRTPVIIHSGDNNAHRVIISVVKNCDEIDLTTYEPILSGFFKETHKTYIPQVEIEGNKVIFNFDTQSIDENEIVTFELKLKRGDVIQTAGRFSLRVKPSSKKGEHFDPSRVIYSDFEKIQKFIDQVTTDSDGNFTFKKPVKVIEMSKPSKVWVLEHDLGGYPDVNTIDTAGNEVYGRVVYISTSKIEVQFTVEFGGIAVLN